MTHKTTSLIQTILAKGSGGSLYSSVKIVYPSQSDESVSTGMTRIIMAIVDYPFYDAANVAWVFFPCFLVSPASLLLIAELVNTKFILKF